MDVAGKVRHHIVHNSHQSALVVWLLSWALALGGGMLYAHFEHLTQGLGAYWAIQTVTTTGYGDLPPHTNAGHYVAVGVQVLAIPVWSIAVGLAWSWIVSIHVKHHLG